MYTPKQLMDRHLPASERAVAEGLGSDPAGMPVMTARAICRGIEWMAEGTYRWLADDGRGTGTIPLAAPVPTGPPPEGMVLTPVEAAVALVARLERMPSMDDSGLTHRHVRELGRAMAQLAAGTYPYALSPHQLEMRAEVARRMAPGAAAA